MPNFLKTPASASISGIKNVLGQRGPGLNSAPSLTRKENPRLAKTPKAPRSSSGRMSLRNGTVDAQDPSQTVKSPTYINTQLFKNGGSVPGAAPKKQLNKSPSGSKVISSKNF